MAVLQRQSQRVHLPADFGLGLAVTAVLGSLLLLLLAAASEIPSAGPRGESRAPDASSGAGYVDIAPPSAAPGVLPTP